MQTNFLPPNPSHDDLDIVLARFWNSHDPAGATQGKIMKDSQGRVICTCVEFKRHGDCFHHKDYHATVWADYMKASQFNDVDFRRDELVEVHEVTGHFIEDETRGY